MWYRPRKKISNRIEQVEKKIDGECAVHPAEAEEGYRCEPGADDDQLARTKARDHERTDPNCKKSRDRESERNVAQVPVIRLLKIIIKEREIIVGYADGYPEGDEGGSENPGTAEASLLVWRMTLGL